MLSHADFHATELVSNPYQPIANGSPRPHFLTSSASDGGIYVNISNLELLSFVASIVLLLERAEE